MTASNENPQLVSEEEKANSSEATIKQYSLEMLKDIGIIKKYIYLRNFRQIF